MLHLTIPLPGALWVAQWWRSGRSFSWRPKTISCIWSSLRKHSTANEGTTTPFKGSDPQISDKPWSPLFFPKLQLSRQMKRSSRSCSKSHSTQIKERNDDGQISYQAGEHHLIEQLCGQHQAGNPYSGLYNHHLKHPVDTTEYGSISSTVEVE